MESTLPLGVCVLPESGANRSRTVVYPGYVFEILEHAGLFHGRIEWDDLEGALDDLRILVTVGEVTFGDSLTRKLGDWIEKGGSWLSVAGVCGMDQALGAEAAKPDRWSWVGGIPSLGEGYLVPLEGSHPALAHITRPVHLFGGATVIAKGAKVLARVDDKHGRPTDRPALLENVSGKGRTLLLACDLTGTVVRIQQGVGVTRDGVPAPDGSAPTNDRILKADDGAVLDWDLDRDPVPGTGGYRAFIEPMADLWREIFLRSIFYLAREQEVRLPMLWLYPRRLPALAHLSHDTDENEPDKAERLLELLSEAKVKASWCVILPGYDAALISKIKSAGHELATHYDAISEGRRWSQAEWRRQHEALQKLFGEVPVTNKNHYTRWEGDCEFFEWCVDAGIQLDQSKAASKTGEAGFNFGTCHLYFPITVEGERIDCLEMCTPIWDPPSWAPAEIVQAALFSVKRHHGILHLLFHPYHVTRADVAEALLMSVRCARKEGLEWWTAREINRWERARRQVKLESFSADAASVSLTLHSGAEMRDATILCLAGDQTEGTFEAWGFKFKSVICTLEAGQRSKLELTT